MTRTRAVYFTASLLLTAGVLAYLFQHVTLREVFDLIAGAAPAGILAFVVLSLLTSLFRMWRYRLLLGLSGYAPGALPMFLVVLVRNLFSDLLPARLGSLIYVYIITARLGVPLGPATSSFALAFLFDILALAPLILLAVLFAGQHDFLSPLPLLSAALLLGAVTCSLIYFLPCFFEKGPAVIQKIKFLPERFRSLLGQALAAARDDVIKVRQAGIYTKVLVLSVIVRFGKYASLYAFLYALLSPRGFALADLQPARIFLGLCASELAASLPISGIAGFGAYQGAWTLTFTLLGFPIEIARITSLSHHLFTQVYGYSLGLLALLILLLPVFKPVRGETTPE